MPQPLAPLFAGLLALPAMAATPTLLLTTEHSPPVNIVSDDGRTVRGVVADKVLEMMRRAGISYRLAPSGWNRAYELARIRPDTCVFSAFRLPERETLFTWLGPLSTGEWGLYGLREQPDPPRQLSDIRYELISGYRNDAVASYLRSNGYAVSESESPEGGLASLLMHRTPYWAAEVEQANALIDKAKVQGKVATLFVFYRNSLYLACNPKVDAALISRLRQAMGQMQEDGSMRRIDAAYAQP